MRFCRMFADALMTIASELYLRVLRASRLDILISFGSPGILLGLHDGLSTLLRFFELFFCLIFGQIPLP